MFLRKFLQATVGWLFFALRSHEILQNFGMSTISNQPPLPAKRSLCVLVAEVNIINQRLAIAALASLAAPGSAFQAHGIWWWGVNLMHNLNFAGKALLISSLFLVPIALLGFFFFSATREFQGGVERGVCSIRASTSVGVMSVRQRVWPSGQSRSKQGAQSSAGR